MDIFEIVAALCAADGVSGDEENAGAAAVKLLEAYGEAEFDSATGNVFFQRKGTDSKLPTVLLDAHIDEVGFVVTDVTNDGFIKVAACGGIDRRVLLAQQVTIYGTAGGKKEKLVGITASVPPHLNKDSSKTPEVSDVLIDTGFTTKEEVLKRVRLGDRVLIENSAVKLIGDKVTSKALDDRAGCAALILAAHMLKDEELACNVAITLTSQEEVGERGAKTAAYGICADMAVEVDVSFANNIGESEAECSPLGSGVMIGVSPSLSRKMSRDMQRVAEECGIPYTIEVMSETTGTNADVIGVTRGGVPTVTLSIPERNMHTPVEVVSLSDIENTARLIAQYLKRVYREL